MKRAEVESWMSGSLQGQREKLNSAASSLRNSTHPVMPFHWQLEFPEVFGRDNAGFDAIIGNPPFLGGSYITRTHGTNYFLYLTAMYIGCVHHCDYVGYFIRRTFSLVRASGVIGIIATKTISQGDTREGALRFVLNSGGHIIRLRRSIVWPGEAAVVVVMLHILKGSMQIQRKRGRSITLLGAGGLEPDIVGDGR